MIEINFGDDSGQKKYRTLPVDLLPMAKNQLYSKEELRNRAILHYMHNQKSWEEIKIKLETKLNTACRLYAMNNSLPFDAITAKTRVKSLDSLLNKMERKNWPQFTDPATEVKDLIGARITCWFLDDCDRIIESLQKIPGITIIKRSKENYIEHPKATGYRALHVLAAINFKKITAVDKCTFELKNKKMIFEIQVRTRLQDAWGDITHDLYYRSKHFGSAYKKHDRFLSAISNRLLKEDIDFLKLKDIYKKGMRG